MSSEIDLAVLIVSALLFGVLSGAHTALELVSFRQSEKDDDEAGDDTSFIHRLAGSPIYHYLSLGLGRVLVIAVFVVASSRFAVSRLPAGALFAAGFCAFLVLVVLVPLVGVKIIALRDPEKYLDRTRFVTYPIVYLVWPIVYVGVAALKRISPRGVDLVSLPIMPFKRRIELLGYKNGGDDSDERELVESAFDFGDTKTREVMIPRIDMVAVNVHTTPAEAVDLIIEAGHSRVPVYDDTVDKIVGVLHAKDVLARVVAGEEFAIRDIMRDAYFVPESKKIGDLLSEFRKRRIHIAIAVDEYGGTAGLVTMEDVLEELVGDIQDEFDAEEELVRTIDADSVVCSARVRLDELNETFGIDLPEGDADSLGGFLYESIGRVPRVGEVFATRGLEFRVESVVRQRIDKVRIKGLSSFRKKPESTNG
jgi:CBS domain containing-hemolysin-like protein